MKILKKMVAITFVVIGYVIQGISGIVILLSGLCLFITLVASFGVAIGCEAPNGIHPYTASLYMLAVFIVCSIIFGVCYLLPSIDDIIES